MTKKRDVRWKRAPGSEEGYEQVGTMLGEPDVELLASKHRWSVKLMGVVARERIIEEHWLDRVSRRDGTPPDRLEFAKRQAEEFAAEVLSKRDGA